MLENTLAPPKGAATVADLMGLLETLPKDMLLAQIMYSESCLLKISEIEVTELCAPRPDGWLQNKRPDKPSQKYLRFPGN